MLQCHQCFPCLPGVWMQAAKPVHARPHLVSGNHSIYIQFALKMAVSQNKLVLEFSLCLWNPRNMVSQQKLLHRLQASYRRSHQSKPYDIASGKSFGTVLTARLKSADSSSNLISSFCNIVALPYYFKSDYDPRRTWAGFTYFSKNLNSNNLSNAYVSGMKEDLNVVDNEYQAFTTM